MTTPGSGTKNTSGQWSTTGIQAESVHNSQVYIVNSESPPQRKYEVGVRYLEDGVPGQARNLIHEAIAHDFDSAKVRFHWTLAMLSKRSYRDLTHQDREQLDRLAVILPNYADDDWKRSLTVIFMLLNQLRDPEGDPEPVLIGLDSLPPLQRDMIARHLDLVLVGSIRDSLWTTTRQAAERAQADNDRLNRAWAYFHPDPAQPRARIPSGEDTTVTWTVTDFGAPVWSGTRYWSDCPMSPRTNFQIQSAYWTTTGRSAPTW